MNKNNRILTLIIAIVFLGIGAYILIDSKIYIEYAPEIETGSYEAPIKKKGINEYIPASVTQEDMVKTYFSTYTTMLFEDINGAYSLLTQKMREEKFPNLNIFKTSMDILTGGFTELPKIDTYEIGEKDGKQTIKISDKQGNVYKFYVEAVMKYTVEIE